MEQIKTNVATIETVETVENTEKFTRRDFLNAVLAGEYSEQVVNFATTELGKMDAQNEKRKTTLTKKQEANEELIERIKTEVLSETAMTASEVAAVVEVSTQKASALLKKLADAGKVQVTSVKRPGTKSTVKAYSLV